MTHPSTPAARICPNCDGFATVAITTGSRDRHGHLPTLTIACRACNGTGTVPARRVREGARA
ncbi:hypothetical protein ACFUKV_14840 [Streptomyces paradoxus]|jgi:RNase P subunit RPR2|uniref:hypothetical protein n=1 Tax=Streptomyces TaxID=1883 RepID=UPI00362FAFA7